MAKRCNSSWDCSSQQSCVNGFCEAKSECSNDEDRPECEERIGECLGPAPPPEPNPNGPNCGIDQLNLTPTRDCVPDCVNFCDEWAKISANLTADTEIKDCDPDDACSACRTCERSGEPDPDQVDAIKERYGEVIDEVYEDKAAREKEQEKELEELEQTYKDGIKAANDRIDEIDEEIDQLDPEVDEDQIESLRVERNRLVQYKADLTRDYLKQREDLKKLHQEQLKQYDEIVDFLKEERDRKLEALVEKSICKDISVNDNRPCYCPPYVDDNGKVVNDSLNRECQLCNTTTGKWEDQPQLCIETCTKTATCDDGTIKTATISAPRSEGRNLCEEAAEAAFLRCGDDLPDPSQACPCPEPECEVSGPFTGTSVPYVARPTSASTDQSGDPVGETKGSYLKVRFESLGNNKPQKIFIDPQGTSVNGGKVKFQAEEAYIGFDGGGVPGIVGGTASIDGPSSAGLIVSANVDNVVTVPDISIIGKNLLYIWRYDDKIMNPLGQDIFVEGQRLPWTIDGYTPMQSLHPPSEEEPGALDYSRIILPFEIIGSYVTVDITFQEGIEEPNPVKSNPAEPAWDPYYDTASPPLISAPLEPEVGPPVAAVEGTVTLNGTPRVGYFLTTSIESLVPDKTFKEVYPGVGAVTFQWINYVTGFTVGFGNELFLTPGLAGERFFPQATFRNYTDSTPQQIPGPPSEPIEFDPDQDIPENCNPNDYIYNVLISGVTTQGQTLEARLVRSGNVAATTFEGPFYQWYRGDDPITDARGETYTLQQEDVDNYISCTAEFSTEQSCFNSARSSPEGPVLNIDDAPEGSVFIVGDMKVGSIVSITENIKHKDGINDKLYVWYRDGKVIGGASKSIYKLVPADQGTRISAEVAWTTDYDKDYQKKSRENTKVKLSNVDTIVRMRSTIGAPVVGEFDVEFEVLNLPTGVPLKQISTSFYWGEEQEDGSRYINIRPVGTVGNPGENPGIEFALNFGLTSEWSKEEVQDCPEGWDCEYSTYDENGEAKPGSQYYRKCPYPCHEKQTYEEYKKNKPCERTCEDRCYRYLITEKKGVPPTLPPNHIIVKTLNNGTASVTYIIEYCTDAISEYVDPVTGELVPCFQPRELSYIGIYRLKLPSFDYYLCDCDNAVGKRRRNPGGVEYHLTRPGMGPWKLVLDKNGGYKSTLECPFQTKRFANLTKCKRYGNRTEARVCGLPGKYALARNYFVVDSNPESRGGRQESEFSCGGVYTKDTVWANRAQLVQQGTEDQQAANLVGLNFGLVGAVGLAATIPLTLLAGQLSRDFEPDSFIPGVPASVLPPRCFSQVPKQVGYINLKTQTVYMLTRTMYSEFKDSFFGEIYGSYNYEIVGPGVPLYDESRYTEKTEPGFRSKTPDPIYPTAELLDEKQTAAPVYINGQSKVNLVYLRGYIPNNENFFGDQWRFLEEGSDTTQYFRVTPGGQVQVRGLLIPVGTYTLTPQTYDNETGLWSNPVTITVTVVD